jgi:A/G-specific adenine glycosylase
MDFGATWCTSQASLFGLWKVPFYKDCQANLSDQVFLLLQKPRKRNSELTAIFVDPFRQFVLLQNAPAKRFGVALSPEWSGSLGCWPLKG